MQKPAFFNRIEISFYSTLISLMSGVNLIRAKTGEAVIDPVLGSSNTEVNPIGNDLDLPRISFFSRLKLFVDVITPLMVWMILGFAAGFLIGMLRLR